MTTKWTRGRSIQITTRKTPMPKCNFNKVVNHTSAWMSSFKFLSFTAVFTQSKVHLSDGIYKECTFQNQTSNSLAISLQGFLRTNTDSWVNSAISILLALSNGISYEWLFQNLRMKYIKWYFFAKNSVVWNL